jgi:hypothetical protein
MRMGKGKGSKKKKIFLINQGDIFIEIKISSLRSLKDFKLFLKVIKKNYLYMYKVVMKKIYI